MTAVRPASADASLGTVRLTVAVPTFRRPDHLRAALPLLLVQARGTGDRYDAEVLVVDNDPDGSGAAVVAEFAAPELRYVAEPTPGIAAVRNRAMDEAAGSALLAFIDDDERPEEGWLSSLLATWEAGLPAAVAGRVVAEYTGELDPWIRAGDFFVRRRLPTGTAVDVAATSNLLLDLVQVRALGVRFATDLGLGGGEDSLFSRALTRAGARILWCDESVAIDCVPRSRMTRSWVLTRAWSHGNAAVLTELRLAAGPAARSVLRLRWATRGLLRVTGGGVRWAWGGLVRSDRHRARGLRALCRGAGMVGAAWGVVFQEYARDGRRWRLSWGGAR
ncbi:glycosyltransferase family 2 protein [Blastococcus sp. LR1]|uniref:glycosyltransferase family 2 protein n=1 Tax=Blastococcus sp. LR1 TaxID=2877000 RepID=UPI001CCB9DAE|nr:glycosyltransferase [Blastococcus sp. LR1]MCA0144561.1 glycosyltransferase [Blastococcus sp. LR1]